MKHIFSVIDMKLRTVILLKFIVVISLMLDDICAQNPATLPTNIRVIPEEGQLRISWTISPDAKSSDFYRIRGVTRNKTEVTQYLSWTENQLLLKATPCVLYAVQLCVGVSYFGITECILQTATPLPHPPSRPKSLLVTNNPVVSGQDVTWTAPDALEPFCALYYEVRYGPDPLPNNVVQVTEITFRATSLPWHTLITYEVRAAYQNPASVGSPATFSLKTVDGPDLTVTDLVVTKSNTLITVQWKGPWWASFNVGYGENGTNVVIPASYGQMRYSFQTAKPCTHFFVWVVAFTRLNYAHPATFVVQTDPEAQPSYPTNVRVHPTCGTLTVTWEHDGTKYHVINYEVIVTRAGTTDSIIKTVQKAKSIMFSGLVCDKPYLVTVSAVNACGRSIESNPIYVIAQNQVPASKLTSLP